jgi:hypothetical protein
VDKSKIIRLIEAADDIVSALYRQGANKDYKCKELREKMNAIAAAINDPPKSNADCIRQMTDEELAESLSGSVACRHIMCCLDTSCYECTLKWLKQEVSEDDKR